MPLAITLQPDIARAEQPVAAPYGDKLERSNRIPARILEKLQELSKADSRTAASTFGSSGISAASSAASGPSLHPAGTSPDQDSKGAKRIEIGLVRLLMRLCVVCHDSLLYWEHQGSTPLAAQ